MQGGGNQDIDESKDQIDEAPAFSFSDICFILFGRAGIIIFNIIMGLGMIGVCVLFYLFFTMTALTLLESTQGTAEFKAQKAVIVSCLAIIQSFVML